MTGAAARESSDDEWAGSDTGGGDAGGGRQEGGDRIASLDLVRGVAVLGILAVNIAGFAGPSMAPFSPHVTLPGSPADEWAFAAIFLVFEGKMRALFSLLFGASLVLFIDRKEVQGQTGAVLQIRRLLWLAVFGYLHFLLLWWGDILFLYAVVGLVALFFHRLPPRLLITIALATFTLWQAMHVAESLPKVAAEMRVQAGTASPADARAYHARHAAMARALVPERQAAAGSFAGHVAYKLHAMPLAPFHGVAASFGETFPFLLIGMALLRGGFFSGGWSRAALRRTALAGIGLGALATLPMLGWVMPLHFPPDAMIMLTLYGTGFPHLAMALGYAALLVLAAPRLRQVAAGRRLEAAGRMAFSNYIGTSAVMTALFYGWGLGLYGRFGLAALLPFVLLGWALMLGCSAPWLARFRQGPLEWLWRSLTEGRRLAFRR